MMTVQKPWILFGGTILILLVLFVLEFLLERPANAEIPSGTYVVSIGDKVFQVVTTPGGGVNLQDVSLLENESTSAEEDESGEGSRKKFVFPPKSRPYGMDHGKHLAEYARWLAAIPVPDNPIFDPTGEKCQVAQNDGKIWNLAGAHQTGVVRTCTVPNGKAFRAPIFVVAFVPDPGQQVTEEQIRGAVEAFMNLADFQILEMEVDGVPVSDVMEYQVISPAFTTVLPENNILRFPPGEYYPSVAGGFMLVLKPLKLGEHTISRHERVDISRFIGSPEPFILEAAVTNLLTVEKKHGDGDEEGDD